MLANVKKLRLVLACKLPSCFRESLPVSQRWGLACKLPSCFRESLPVSRRWVLACKLPSCFRESLPVSRRLVLACKLPSRETGRDHRRWTIKRLVRARTGTMPTRRSFSARAAHLKGEPGKGQHFVYAAKSPAFPGLINLGSTQDIVAHLRKLNAIVAPAPFVIMALASSSYHIHDKLAAHAFFARAHKVGEFFELKDSEAINYFAEINPEPDLDSLET